MIDMPIDTACTATVSNLSSQLPFFSDDPVHPGRKKFTWKWRFDWACNFNEISSCDVCYWLGSFKNPSGPQVYKQFSMGTMDCGMAGGYFVTSTWSNLVPGTSYTFSLTTAPSPESGGCSGTPSGGADWSWTLPVPND